MRIAVVAVGTRGDVEPHAALCEGLRDAGYDARLCAPADLQCTYATRGIPFEPIPVRFRDLITTAEGDALLGAGSNGFQFLRGLTKMAAGVAELVIQGIQDACRDADAVCYSPLAIPALYFARENGIPAFATSLQPLGRTGAYPNPLLPLPEWMPRTINRLSFLFVEQAFWQPIRPLLRRYVRDPLSVRGHFSQLYQEPTPILFAYSDLVVPRPGDWKPWMQTTGYWKLRTVDWQPPEGLEEFLAGGPTVCVGFGSMTSKRIERIVDISLEAIHRNGQRAVVLKGWSRGGKTTAGRRGNVFLMDGAPHEWLFPKVAAVIHHGGAGTTAAALRAGVPSVISPFFFDQNFWADRLAASGLGPPPVRFRRLSTRGLMRALDIALNSAEIRHRLELLGGRLRQEDGVGKAVGIIHHALGNPRR